MPRGFTEQEKLNIRNRLLDSGHEAFGLHGIRKTSVEDLAVKAGISKGAFYQFFSSKEELYFAIMDRYEKELHGSIFGLLDEGSGDERQLLKTIMKEILEQVDRDPFIKRILTREEFDYLWQKSTPEQLEEAMKTDVDFSARLVEIWKKKGKLKIEDPRIVAGVFRAVFFTLFHKEDIGPEVFNDVLDLLLESAIERIVER